MMDYKIIRFLIYSNFLIGIYSSSILNFITTGPAFKEGDNSKNCLCNGPSCICCIDFNVSFTDLGGPGCIRIKYLSPEKGVDLNVSYGDSLLHNELVKGPNPAPTCLNVISTFAQVCARLLHFEPFEDGLHACVQLEPTLIGEPQAEFPLGCFRMGPNGIVMEKTLPETIQIQPPNNDENDEQQNSTEIENDDESSEVIAGLNAEEIMEAVNETANRGIALLSSWLGLTTTTTDIKEKGNSNITETEKIYTIKN